ncbi:MAG: flagellar basal-body rod protein FlgG [Janthinobacterium lividum]
MTSALQIARSGLDALDQKMKTISNNLANVNTTGFKKDRANFETLMYQNTRNPGDPSAADSQYAVGLGTGTGVRVAGTERIHTQGSLTQTDNALDLAIEGSGMFQVTTSDGKTAYTRDGSFKPNSEGQIVSGSGNKLDPAITIPDGAKSIVIAPDGTVSATLAGQTESTQLGQILVARFLNPAGLEPIGENLYSETVASGTPQPGVPGTDGVGLVRQGSLEASNVSTVQELVDMIETQRAYEVNAKVINSADEMQKYVNQNL